MPFSKAMELDKAQKPLVRERQRQLLEERYNCSKRPMEGAMMSGGREPVQEGVRVKLPNGQTWESLADLTAEEIREQDLHPKVSGPCHIRSRRRAARFSLKHRSR